MGKLLKFEYRRLFQMASFYIFIGLIVVVNFMSILSQANGDIDSTIERADIFRSVFQCTSIVLIFAIFIPIYVCRNFSDGTIKNICAKGYDCVRLFFAQFIVVVTVSLAFCIVAVLTNLLFGAIFIHKTGDMQNAVSSVALQLVVLIAYTCVFFGISSAIAKTGGTIAVNIVFYVMGGLVFMLIDTILYNYIKDTSMKDFAVSDYWIGNVFSECFYTVNGNVTFMTIVISIVYSVIFLLLGYFVARKREL